MAEIPKRLKMPLGALWRHELYHPISMQHRAHNVRAGHQLQSNFVCVCLCVKELTDKWENAIDGLGCFSGSFDNSDHGNGKNVANTDTKLQCSEENQLRKSNLFF